MGPAADSVVSSVVCDDAGGSLLLDEHFRCHPEIADVLNRLFYEGRLTVLTDTRARPSLDRRAVIWAPVAGRAVRPGSGSSWTNHDEIDKVEASVRHLLEQLPAETGATTGVVTPFKAEEEALKRRLRLRRQRPRPSWLSSTGRQDGGGG